MLVLNYNHLGNTNPNIVVLTTSLPVIGSTILGLDESSVTASWGHAGNTLMGDFDFLESRWYCKTSNHSRVIHFKTDEGTWMSVDISPEDKWIAFD